MSHSLLWDTRSALENGWGHRASKWCTFREIGVSFWEDSHSGVFHFFWIPTQLRGKKLDVTFVLYTPTKSTKEEHNMKAERTVDTCWSLKLYHWPSLNDLQVHCQKDSLQTYFDDLDKHVSISSHTKLEGGLAHRTVLSRSLGKRKLKGHMWRV